MVPKAETKTVAEVVKAGLCVGCGTCVSLCPAAAVSVSVDKNLGVYLAGIDSSKCKRCSLCCKVCPGVSVNFKELSSIECPKQTKSLNNILLGNYVNCYVGYSTDPVVRFDSSSGGVITQLLILALEEGLIDGALVTRMRKDKPLEPEPFIAKTKTEILEASKSKYCPVPTNIALKEILMNGGRYAFVGLPCHIHGLRKAQKLNVKLRDRVVFSIGLFCSHDDSFYSTRYLLNRFKVKPSNVTKISYRGKGWPGVLCIEQKSGINVECAFHDWIRLHEYCFFTPDRCLVCCDHAAELADISAGDAWLPKFSRDSFGTSVCISRTKKGEELLQLAKAQRQISISSIDSSDVIKSQGNMRFKKNGFPVRRLIFRMLGKSVPSYDSKFPKTGFAEVPRSAIIFANRMLASKIHSSNGLDTLMLLQGGLKKLYSSTT
jgi:coenzyme F420 hydrogenase subunit beta